MKVFLLWAKGDTKQGDGSSITDAPYLLDAADEYSLEEWESEEAFWNRPDGPLASHDKESNPVRVASVEIADQQLYGLFSSRHLGGVRMQPEQEPGA